MFYGYIGIDDSHLHYSVIIDVSFIPDPSQEIVHAFLALALTGLEAIGDVHIVLWCAVAAGLNGLQCSLKEAVGHLISAIKFT